MSKAAAILVTELTVDDNRKVQKKTIAIPTAAIANIRESYLIVEPAQVEFGADDPRGLGLGKQQPCTQIISKFVIWDVAETPSRIATLMNEDEGADTIAKLLSEIDATLTGIMNMSKRIAANG